jgi:2-dehydro-3-deoxygluconokinase
MSLKIRPKEDWRWDLVALGEGMLRLDPGDRRVATTRKLDVWEGGGE